ncbi:MAG: LPS export ABC transporter periplasmic protein LptC [candidate division Zixibacteria bacterium]|nr:LPS export ABC transporter periplasmic protein LptC [candidate division Zixibacteria bacterium]
MKHLKYLIALLLILSFSGCTDPEPPRTNEQSVEYPQSELYNSTIILTAKGVKNTELNAEYIAKYKDKKETFTRGIDAVFYNEEGEKISDLVADSGWVNEETQMMEVLGNVVVVNDEGVKLETESLRWDPQIDKIVTDDFVKITTEDGDILTGYGLQTDQRLRKFKILKNVQGKIEKLPEEELE